MPDGITAPFYPRTIWIRAEGSAVRGAVRHECFHAWLRSIIGVPAGPDEEPAAYRFADGDDQDIPRYLARK